MEIADAWFPEARRRAAAANSGGYRAVRSLLRSEGRWSRAEAAVRQAIDDTNEAGDGSYAATWEYLLVLGQFPHEDG